jgi:hypothetical protein
MTVYISKPAVNLREELASLSKQGENNIFKDLYVNGTIFANDGSATTPTFGFNTESGTGIYLDSPGNLSFSVGDTRRFYVSTSEIAVTVPISNPAVSSRDKFRVWNIAPYSIGMENNVTFGAINNDYAMTFQMNSDVDRGFWWGDSAHDTAHGAMSLSTQGKLTVAHSLRLGYGEADLVIPGASYRLDVLGNTLIGGGLVIEGSIPSSGIDYGYYQNAGTNVILKGDANGRSGIFFQSEANGVNINHGSDYGFIQYHARGFDGTTGENSVLAIGVVNDATDTLVLQSPYNGGVKVGYRDVTNGTDLTLQTVFHDGYHPNADKWTTPRTLALTGDVSGSVAFDGTSNVSFNTVIADDSHFHDGRYYTETESDTRYLRSDAPSTLSSVLTVNESGNIIYTQNYDGNPGIYIPRPQNASLKSQTATHTGAIAINLPVATSGQNDMVSFWVDIYDYSGGNEGESVSMFVYGYVYSTNNWLNVGAVVLSDKNDRDYTVRFCHDGARHIVTIGEITSAWSYLQVNVRDFQAGFNAAAATYDDDWNISLITTLPTTVAQTSTDNYPVSKKWSAARTITLGGVLSGSVSLDGSGNVTLTAAHTSDPVLTLAGDASGSATFTNLGNATLTVAIVDDSHNHTFVNAANPATAPDAALEYLNTNGTTTDSPTTDWFNTIRMGHGDPNGYYNNTLAVQMTGSNPGGLFGRTRTNGVAGSWNRFFADNYHPNADKWTTSRTVTFSGGDVAGSFTIDGSGNPPNVVLTVADDSHNHDGRYFTETEINAKLTDGTVTAISNQAQVGSNMQFFTNDGGGNQGIRFNALNFPSLAAENGCAWELDVSNDAVDGNLVFYSDNNVVAGAEAIWSETFKLQSSDRQAYVNGSKVFHDAYHPNADTLTTSRNINGVPFNGAIDITVADATKLPLTGGTMTGNLEIVNSGPTLRLIDNTAGADDFFLHANSNSFYVLTDRDDDTTFETPHAFQLNNDNSTGSIYGQRLFADNYHPNADTLTTSRNINGVPFNGAIDITVADATKLPLTGGTMTGNIVYGTNDRDNSQVGTYDVTKTQQIWAMGAAYKNSATGVDFGNLYGMAYVHSNNANGANMAGGHQIAFVNNGGTPGAAIGMNGNIWTSGTSTAATFNATSTAGGGFQGIANDLQTTPSFTWSGDLTTGIYHPGGSQIGFTTNGTNKLTISTTAITSNLAVTVPALTILGATAILTLNDSDSGSSRLFQSGTGMYIDNVTAGGNVYVRTSGAVIRAIFADSGDIQFRNSVSNGSPFYWDASTSRLGIGTETPQHPLDVVGVVNADGVYAGTGPAPASPGQIAVTSTTNPFISFHASNTGSRDGYMQYIAAENRFIFASVAYTESAGSFRAPLFYANTVGSETAPTFSFQAGANTGMYRADAATLGFTTQGTLKLSVGATVISNVTIDIPGAASEEKIRFGFGSATTQNTYIGWYRIGTTRAGYIQSLSDRFRINTDSGPRLDLMNSGTAIFANSNIQIAAEGSTTSSTRSLQIQALGYAIVDLEGDRNNTTGEPGGAGIAFAVDGTGVNGICSFINAAGTNGVGGSFTGTNVNDFLVGTTATTQDLVFGRGNSVVLVVGSSAFRPDTNGTLGLGSSTFRWSQLFAATTTISTSDATLKQDIDVLSEAETRVAHACKKLMRKYRFKEDVAKKGDDVARIHFGIMAQDLRDAFSAEGLDAHRYAMFCSNTHWENSITIPAREGTESTYDDDGNRTYRGYPGSEENTQRKVYDTFEEAPEDAIEVTRLGVRYSELFAFIIAAL